MVYFITQEMHAFAHQFPIRWEKTTKPNELGKPRKLGPGDILQYPLDVENLRNWYSYFSHSMGTFFHQIPSNCIFYRMENAWVFSSTFPQHQKSQRSPSNGKGLGNWYPYFFHKIGVFFHQIPLLWYTSSYRKCMGFLINVPQYRKRQEDLSNGKILGCWSPGKSFKTHRMWRTWKIGTHTFPRVWVLFTHQIHILWYTSQYV